jgi:hypothetical protein|nr:MAG TPA: hypothetical protein [Bacteriophage sp.]
MCLYLRYKEECVATSNICVWKALINYGRFGYYSPIFNYRYNIGETYTSYLDRNKNSVSVDIGLHSFGYNIKIISPYAGRYECRGDTHNSFDIDESIDTIGLFIIPEGSHYYTDGYFYASDTLKLLRTLPKNKFFNYMMNRRH